MDSMEGRRREMGGRKGSELARPPRPEDTTGILEVWNGGGCRRVFYACALLFCWFLNF